MGAKPSFLLKSIAQIDSKTKYENFWPAEMQENNSVKNKVPPSICMKFWSRNNLDKLDWLTPQDLYEIHKLVGTIFKLFDSLPIMFMMTLRPV